MYYQHVFYAVFSLKLFSPEKDNAFRKKQMNLHRCIGIKVIRKKWANKRYWKYGVNKVKIKWANERKKGKERQLIFPQYTDTDTNNNCDTLLSKMCGFPLAEERKKRKTFFSHTAGSMGSSVRGILRSRGVSEFSCFCYLPPLPELPRPPTLHVFFGL